MHTQSLSHFQVFVTTWTVTCQAPLSMGFSRQKYWSGLPSPTPGDLPDPEMERGSPESSILAGGCVTTMPPCCPCCSVTQLCLTLCDSWTAARQAPLSSTVSQSLLRLMSIESVMPCSYLILCRPLLLLPSFPASGNEFQ